jgi:hypothetical protein
MPRAFALLALALAGCGKDPQCGAIASAYANAISQAQRCDPQASSPCGEIRRASLASGSDFCDRVAIDPAQANAVDDLLARFAAQRCPLGPALPCPELDPSAFECRADGQGGDTCVRR